MGKPCRRGSAGEELTATVPVAVHLRREAAPRRPPLVMAEQHRLIAHPHPASAQTLEQLVLLGANEPLVEVGHHLAPNRQRAQCELALVPFPRRVAAVAAPHRPGSHDRGEDGLLDALEAGALPGSDIGAAEDAEVGIVERQLVQRS
jgi:hypothetical protein